MTMMIPTVHRNGTSKHNLLAELAAAHAALTAAIDTLRQVTVHGRDYYVQGEHAYHQARTEMDARLAVLAQIQRDIRDMHLAIQQQGK
jgi:hypothetical protein